MELKTDFVPGIEFISPVADAESGTLLVKLRVDNPKGEYRSGMRCTLELPASNPPSERVPDTALDTHTAYRDSTP